MDRNLRVAVVGHVEWVEFMAVDRLPAAGQIVHARALAALPAGGGAVAAAQLAKLAGTCLFLTALGKDALGQQARTALEDLGLELHVAWRDRPTRRAVCFISADGERSITVVGERLTPRAEDPLPWERLQDCGGVFVSASDAAGLRRARTAGVLAATPRVSLSILEAAGVSLDALIGSALDPAEQVGPADLTRRPKLLIRTEGAEGGSVLDDQDRLVRFQAQPLGGPIVDTYGAGDCFAAGVTYGLAAGMTTAQAIALGCRCGAACIQAAGPYAGRRGPA